MRLREGTIPTVLGTAVTLGAAALRANDLRKNRLKKRDIVPMAETALVGFGLAHIVLGAIDMVQNRRR
ncbi:hypothetical protein CPJCM30710_05380 [Clostridium polyendosporum]|uniref:Asparagine synthase n=1 Tax=Clostridium polyendosporum TaxID=69208 RepID=A0A919VF85_9CLOT|nr:asparagine synthase [Clostridium polyendosporum]GIM27872.1 hypothetical protein CPJCM30710_05380 [Clostridium polyendosporum]